MLAFSLVTGSASAETPDDRLRKLELTVEQQQKTIDALTEQSGAPSAPAQAGGLFGGSSLANPNISVLLNSFVYGSNLLNDELEQRGIPGFTTNGIERRYGFNVESAELFIFAPVDPYFNFYTTIPVTDEGAELEEAYVVTTALPPGWQLKGGKFKSNFSRLDAQHPHAWDFADIALPYRAFLGDEALGSEKGIQLTWLPALPVYTLIGAEVLQGENDLLFGADAQEGPHAFSFFVKSSFDTSDNSTLYFGPSVLFGKTRNANILPDTEVNGKSALYGMELVWKWKPTSRKSLTLQSEYLSLVQTGDATDQETEAVDSLERRQDGIYVQAIYRINRWGIGARYEVLDLINYPAASSGVWEPSSFGTFAASGGDFDPESRFNDSVKRGGVEQDLGDKPSRATAGLEFNPSEFSRIRLQYTHDRSAPDSRENNEVIAQFIFGIGAHAAHPF
jgi:hypothetical protein